MRLYEVQNIGGGARVATKTVLLIQAGAGKPVRIRRSHVGTTDNATSWQMHARWQKVNVYGAPAGAGTTAVHQLDEGGAAHGMTVLADLTAEPTSYLATPFRGLVAKPSVIGVTFEALSPDEYIMVEAGDAWGLVVLTATFAASTLAVSALVEEWGS